MLNGVKNDEQFFGLVKNPSLFLRPTGQQISLSDISNQRKNYDNLVETGAERDSYYASVIRAIFSPVVSDFLSFGFSHTSFSTDFEGVWQIAEWMTSVDNFKIGNIQKKKGFTKEELVIHALQQEELKWFGQVPIENLIKLRERGELSELREIIGDNLQAIENSSDQDFPEIGKKVSYNIEQALKRHSSDVKRLNESYRTKFGFSGGSLVVSGVLSIVTAMYPTYASILGTASAIIGGGTAINSLKDFVEKRSSLKELNKKPVAMLFNAKNR